MSKMLIDQTLQEKKERGRKREEGSEEERELKINGILFSEENYVYLNSQRFHRLISFAF